MDWYEAQAWEVVAAVKEQHPEQIGKMDIRTMRKLLAGVYSLPKPKESKARIKVINKQVDTEYLHRLINKAEQYLGDIMYEMAEGDLRKVELMSKRNMAICRVEALIIPWGGSVDSDIIQKAAKFWAKRGY